MHGHVLAAGGAEVQLGQHLQARAGAGAHPPHRGARVAAAQRFGDAIVNVDLLPVGAPRRDWILTLISDGYVTVRHPDKDTLSAMADAVGHGPAALRRVSAS